MAENKGKFYMTTAIAYTSGKPHIGNTYEIILADAIARYKRAEGYDVYFQTGTDEHGQKIQEKAEAAGISPKEFVDQVSGEVKRIWDLVNSSYDNFVRTTDEDHEKCVKKIFKKLYDQFNVHHSIQSKVVLASITSRFTNGFSTLLNSSISIVDALTIMSLSLIHI